MAGNPMGASSPAFPPTTPAAVSAAPSVRIVPRERRREGLVEVVEVSRRRRCHGVFSLDAQLCVVYSLRRVEPGKGVQLVLGHDGPVMTPHMSPTQARNLARALVAAADAADELRMGRN